MSILHLDGTPAPIPAHPTNELYQQINTKTDRLKLQIVSKQNEAKDRPKLFRARKIPSDNHASTFGIQQRRHGIAGFLGETDRLTFMGWGR